jgi:hypothetical protein
MDPDIRYGNYRNDEYGDEYRNDEYLNSKDNSGRYLFNALISVGFLLLIGYSHQLLVTKACPKIKKYYQKIQFNRSFPVIELTELDECLNNVCSICLEEYDEDMKICKLRCSHIYHKECIMSWFKNHNECPLCRKDIL